MRSPRLAAAALLAVLVGLVFWPVAALAQEAGALPPSPEISSFGTFFWTAVALPFLAAAAKLGADLFFAWGRAKGIRQIAALERAYHLADDIVGYVDAKTRAARDEALSPTSPGGASVTKGEADRLQRLAAEAAQQWLGEGGLEKLAKEAGIAASSALPWIQGVIEKRFNLKKIAETAAEAPPVVGFGTPVDAPKGVVTSPK